MDINDFRSLATVMMFIAFISICLWAFSSKKKSSFDEAAQLVFADEENQDNKDKKVDPS